MEKYCISVDWLQVCCYSNNLAYLLNNDYYNKVDSLPYWLELQPLETRSFARFIRVHIKVGNDWRYCADILAVPRSTMLNSNIVLVKIHNRFLYCQNYIKLLYDICATFKLSIKGLTRLDLCYDCNSFHGGLKPHKFIKEFVTAEFDSPRYIYKVGAKQFRVYGGKSVSSATKFSGIEFGSGKSSKRCYIYDKTRELTEVKDKPWIRDTWVKNGLISFVKKNELEKITEKQKEYEINMFSLKDYIVTPVWRFEISIKADGNKLLDLSTGELIRLSPQYVSNQKEIEKLFYIYANKVFDFRENTGQKNTRFYHNMDLFEYKGYITEKPIKIKKNLGTGRSERMCYNKLVEMSKEYTDLSEQRVWGLREAMNFLLETAGVKNEIVRLKEHESYLNEIYGHKFCREDIDYLLSQIERTKEAENNLLRDNAEHVIYP